MSYSTIKTAFKKQLWACGVKHFNFFFIFGMEAKLCSKFMGLNRIKSCFFNTQFLLPLKTWNVKRHNRFVSKFSHSNSKAQNTYIIWTVFNKTDNYYDLSMNNQILSYRIFTFQYFCSFSRWKMGLCEVNWNEYDKKKMKSNN